MKYLGIDWGEKRIGLALADSEIKIATPFKVVGDIDELVRVVEDEQIDTIVLGKPYQISNFKFPISKQFEKFFKIIKQKVNLPIEMVDERLSSKAADALAGDTKTNPPLPRLRRARASRDAVAAMLILQTYLDMMSN